MITRTKVKQLEKRYTRRAHADGKRIISCDVTEDGRLLDDEGYVMTDEEVKQFKAKNEETGVDIVICERSYEEPKLKAGSTTVPY